ncbi:MAG: GerAB/ArcD/ProY family transporter [Bacillota bacterium]
MEQGHIGGGQAALLIFTILATKVLLVYPTIMVQDGRGAGWMLVLLNAAWGAAAAWVLAALARRFPGRGLAEIAQEVAGPVLGTAFGLAVAGGLVFLAALVLRLLSEAFIISILPQTPPSVLIGTAVALAIYAGYLGLEPLARAHQVVIPPVVAAIVVVLLLVLREAQAGWLYPILGPGLPALAAASLRHAGAWIEVVLLGIYGHAFRRPGDLGRAGLWGVTGAALALAATTAAFTAVFGPEGAAREPFPLYHLARLVYLGRFFQRAESLFVLFWVAGSLAYTAVLLHGAAVTTAQALGVPFYRPLLLPLGLLLFSLALLPGSYTATQAWDALLRQWAALPLFGILVLLLAVGRLRRRGGLAHVR